MKWTALAMALLLASLPAAADPLLYSVQDRDNTVWLLGSVHALRPSDYPLDDRIESAFDEAKRVVLEVAPAELASAHLGSVMLPLAQGEPGERVGDVLTGAERALAERRLAELGLSLEQLQGFEPWFVALQVFSLNLVKHGFQSAEGVDVHYAQRAAAAGKETAGLETAREQFLLFDRLPKQLQKKFLLETLEDSANFRAEMERLVRLWREGDAAALEALIETEFADMPELRDAMLGDRNRRWVDSLEKFIAGSDDTLVIVGALHLVGDDGVVALLRERGYEVEKVMGE